MMNWLSHALVILGALMLSLAALAAIAAGVSLGERSRYGPGPMFADVEIFGLLALVLGTVGIALLWLGRRLARRAPDDAQANQP